MLRWIQQTLDYHAGQRRTVASFNFPRLPQYFSENARATMPSPLPPRRTGDRLAVLSHWFPDALAHRPDLPLYSGVAAYAGLGLWGSIAATLIVELGMFVAGVWL